MSEETRLRKLIEAAILNIHIFVGHDDDEPQPLWHYVGELFDIPSTEAIQLCHEFGYDPHKEISDYRDEDIEGEEDDDA